MYDVSLFVTFQGVLSSYSCVAMASLQKEAIIVH